jgi:hypothetical protein
MVSVNCLDISPATVDLTLITRIALICFAIISEIRVSLREKMASLGPGPTGNPIADEETSENKKNGNEMNGRTVIVCV